MKVLRKGSIAALAAVLLLTLSACSSDEATESAPAEEAVATNTIVDVAVGNEDFSTLVAALTAADLVTTLQGAGPFTVFAPTLLNSKFVMAIKKIRLATTSHMKTKSKNRRSLVH